MRTIILLIILSILIGTTGADRVDEIPLIIKVNMNTDDTISSLLIKSDDITTPLLYFNGESSIRYNVTFLPEDENNIVRVPVEITKLFNIDGSLKGIEAKSDIYIDSTFSLSSNNYYFNTTLLYLLTDDMLNLNERYNNNYNYEYISKEDVGNVVKETILSEDFIDELNRQTRTDNEEFSSTFIQYFSNQYEPKVQEIKEKDSQISALKNVVQLKDSDISMLNINASVRIDKIDTLETENFFLSLLSVTQLLLLASIFTIKSGIFKGFKGIK